MPETIPELLGARVLDAGSSVWLAYEDQTFTYADVAREVDRFAVGLAERGVTRGDRVGILLGNRPETIFAWFAANQLGAIAMPLNPGSKPAEIEGIARVTTPRVIVDSAMLASFTDSGRTGPRAKVTPDDGAVILATSGTTGAPKAVVQTHRTFALTAEAFPWWIGATSEDSFLCTLPLFHINAQAYSTIGSLGCGARLALVPKFSASRFWSDVRRYRATVVNAVGAMINILLATPPSPGDRGHGMRVVYTALALPEARHREFEERFGVSMTVGYGLSETTFGTVWPLGKKPYGTMGVLRQHPRLGTINEAKIVEGELWLSNPAMMKEYFGNPEATAAVLEGKWFKTGDLVTEKDGTFTFVSRKKEVLRRRGENVAAAEIEGVIASHPAVKEAAVIGIPSPLGEDDIIAFVVSREDAGVDLGELRAFVAERLADYKVPVRFHLRESLPRTATERVAKYLLKE